VKNTVLPQIANPAQIEKTVFVVTYGRTGSTLIQNLLNAIDGYCIRGENENAVAPLALAWNTLKQSSNVRNIGKKAVATTPIHPWYGAELINPNRFGRAMANAFIRTVLAPPTGTRVTGFKEIRWAHDPKFLPTLLNYVHMAFPNPHFVFNTRSLDEVAESAWWANMKPEAVTARLTRTEAAFADYLAAYPQRGVHIHYNDYVADQEALAPMYEFIGETYVPDQVAEIMSQRLTHLQKGDR